MWGGYLYKSGIAGRRNAASPRPGGGGGGAIDNRKLMQLCCGSTLFPERISLVQTDVYTVRGQFFWTFAPPLTTCEHNHF